jgi:hypothetical protein
MSALMRKQGSLEEIGLAEEHLTTRTGPGGPTDSVIARFPAQRFLWAVAVGYVLVMVIPAVMLIQGWRTHDWGRVVVGGFMLAVPIPTIWLAVRLAGTSAFLTNGFVSTPRLWGRRVISLAEVTGVGLRYVPGQRLFTWRLKVWPADDDSRWIDSSVVVYVKQTERGEPRGLSNRSGFRKRLRPQWDYVPVLDWDYLAQTPQGQAATAIYNQALIVQGPHGPLATQARQSAARSPGSFETAYWSPNGAIGAIRNGEPEAPQ